MSNLIAAEIQAMAPDAIIELFEVEINMTGEVLRFHAGTNGLGGAIAFGYNPLDPTEEIKYEPYPVEADGFQRSGEGSLPRPKLTISNALGFMTATAQLYDDLIGSKVRRIRTFKKFLNASNFLTGINPQEDPEAKFPIEHYVIERKVHEDRNIVEFELAVPWDMQGTQLPRRQILSNLCPFKYRGEECGYTGPPVADNQDYFKITATETTNPGGAWETSPGLIASDRCGKRLLSCKLRFGKTPKDANGKQLDFSDPYYERDDILNFGGFPGAGRLLG